MAGRASKVRDWQWYFYIAFFCGVAISISVGWTLLFQSGQNSDRAESIREINDVIKEWNNEQKSKMGDIMIGSFTSGGDPIFEISHEKKIDTNLLTTITDQRIDDFSPLFQTTHLNGSVLKTSYVTKRLYIGSMSMEVDVQAHKTYKESNTFEECKELNGTWDEENSSCTIYYKLKSICVVFAVSSYQFVTTKCYQKLKLEGYSNILTNEYADYEIDRGDHESNYVDIDYDIEIRSKEDPLLKIYYETKGMISSNTALGDNAFTTKLIGLIVLIIGCALFAFSTLLMLIWTLILFCSCIGCMPKSILDFLIETIERIGDYELAIK